ncbi:uncharacterized protein LOC126986309 isoform X2 [Eriocheir sinensis]|uniref:uncharacterized protein LOC126986309 isoform X2 n=1 Tax=Eriocheir sinensis TaxID=95602 RepID=UPI0021C75BE7|nr:uncharacterized protein LOC126986309 isoform X2 [Eriocheir sinensis]
MDDGGGDTVLQFMGCNDKTPLWDAKRSGQVNEMLPIDARTENMGDSGRMRGNDNSLASGRGKGEGREDKECWGRQRGPCRRPLGAMGASSVGTQLKCTLWRHGLGHLRQWPWVLGALVVALTPFALLAGLKSTAPPKHEEICHFEARGLSSEWPLGQLQSFVCGLANECHGEGQDDLLDHYPGAAVNDLVNVSQLIDGTDASALDRLIALPWSLNTLKGVTDLIAAPALTALMENGLQVSDIIKSPEELSQKLTSGHDLNRKVVEAFLGARINVSRVFALAGRRGPREVVCSPQYLEEFLVITNGSSASDIADISNSLCHLPLAQAANVTSVFLAALDAQKVLRKVGEVMEAVGGYNKDLLVQQIGGLLAAVSRLEALAPLSRYLQPAAQALSPIIGAGKILSYTKWNETSLADFMGFVEDVAKTFQSDPSVVLTDVAKGTTSAALRLLSIIANPANLTRSLEGLGDPWEAVLQNIGVSLKAVVVEIEAVPDYIRQIPALRFALSLTTHALSQHVYFWPHNETKTWIQEDLDEALGYLLEATEVSMNSTLAVTLLPALRSAASFANASDALSSLVVMEPPLPPHLTFSLLTLFSNCSQLKTAVEGAGLSEWLCERAAWGEPSDEDWETVSVRLCSAGGKTQLRNVTQLLHKALNDSQVSPGSVTPHEVTNATRDLITTLVHATHLHKATQLTLSSASSDPEWWRRFSPKVWGVIGAEGERSDMGLLPYLPPLGAEGIQDIREGVQVSKVFIRQVVTFYLNLVGGECGDLPHSFTNNIRPGALQYYADMATATLDTAVHMVEVTQDIWRPGDLLRQPNVTSFLTNILPSNVMTVVTRGLEILDRPEFEAPAPVPQIIDLLNATQAALASIVEEDNVWAVCGNGSCPHLAELFRRTHLIPFFLALPYYHSVMGSQKEDQEVIYSIKAWHYYPCQNTTGNLPTLINPATNTTVTTLASLSMFFPPPDAFTPAARPTIARIREEVKELEEYICVNFKEILDELGSNEPLTNAGKAFVDKLTPGTVNIGSTQVLVSSLYQTAVQLDPYQMAYNLTGGNLLSLEDLERPFTYLLHNESFSTRMVQEAVERVMESLLGGVAGNETHPYQGTVNRALHAAHNITVALTNTLRAHTNGSIMTLADLLGVSSEDPLLIRLTQGPQGLADYILNQLNTSLISTVMDRDWHGLADSLCNNATSTSPWVELACNYTLGPPPPELMLSNVAAAVMEAVSQFQYQDAPELPPMPTSQLITDLHDLIETLRILDYSAPLDVSALDRFVNATKREMDRLVAGLKGLQEDLPWLMLDTAVRKAPAEVQMVVRQAHFILDKLVLRLPADPISFSYSSPDSTANSITSLTDIHHLINASWVDLLAGVHYNIHQQHGALDNLTRESVCGPNSILKEPEGGDGSFLKAVERLCQFAVSNADDVDLDYFYSMNTSIPVPATKELYTMVRELVDRFEAFWWVGKEEGLQGVLGWPSYFAKENWQDLLTRIYPNITQSNDTDNYEQLIPSLLVAFNWLGVPQNSTTFPKHMVIQMKWMKILLAKDLKEALNSTSELRDVADILTQTLPLAITDLVQAIREQPEVVGEVLVEVHGLDGAGGMCRVNVSRLGSHLSALQGRLCPPRNLERPLIADIRSLLGLDLLQEPNSTMSLEDTLNSTLAYVSTLDQMKELPQRFSTPRDLVRYLGVQRWQDLPGEAFNVTLDEMERNSTMIFASLLGPMVELSQEPTDVGRAVNYTLMITNGYLRLIHWTVELSFGNVRKAYMHKPMVIHLLDLLENLPEIAEEYVTIFTEYSSLQEVISIRTLDPCIFHFTLMERLNETEMLVGGEGEGLRRSKGRRLLNNTIHFLCEPATRNLIMYQLEPGSAPVIMGQRMGVDAATLAHLITETWMAVADVLEGRHERVVFSPPPWLDEDRWDGVNYQLQYSIGGRPFEYMLLDGLFLGLSAAQTHVYEPWVSRVLPITSSAVYGLATRLADNIDESTGRLDLLGVAKGLGRIEDIIAVVSSRLRTHIALLMWLPESTGLWRFVRGDHMGEIYEELCSEGPEHLFLYPNLPQQDWDDVQYLLCNLSRFTLPELDRDLQPLLNLSMVMDGQEVDFTRVRDAVGELMSKLRYLNPHQFTDPFINNDYIDLQAGLTPAQRFVYGLFTPLTWLYRLVLEGGTVDSEYLRAIYLVQATAFLQPITEEDAPSLLQRLVEPDMFVEMMREYQDVYVAMQDTAEEDLKFENGSTYSQVYSEMRATLLKLTYALERSSELGMTFNGALQSVLHTAFWQGDEVIRTASLPVCNDRWNKHEVEEEWVRVGQGLQMAWRQLGRVDEHVDLMCEAPTTSLTHILRSLWEDLGWKEELKSAVTGWQGNTTTTCHDLMETGRLTYKRFLLVVRRYLGSGPARTHFLSCLDDAVHSAAGQQLLGLLVAAGDVVKSLTNNENFSEEFTAFLDALPHMARTLKMLGSRVAVMVPLEEVLGRGYGANLNLTEQELNATRHLLVDLNRVYPGDAERLATLSKTLDGMQKWLKVKEGAGTDSEGKTPLEVLHEMAETKGAKAFAEDLLENVNYSYLLTEADNMRIEAVLSLAWLDSLISNFRLALESLTALSRSGTIMDLEKLISGEKDPVSFLSSSVEFIHMDQWSDLARSFEGLLAEGIPLLTGSQLSEDLQKVIDGVKGLLEVRDMGLLDLTVPVTSLVANWTMLEDYLLRDMGMEPRVVEALATAELNLLELLSLEGTSVEEVLCKGEQMGRLVELPADAQVTPQQLSTALCSANDTEALASSFLNHLNLAPLMTMLTRFGVNASLSSHGVSMGEVSRAIRNVVEASEHMPTIMATLRTFQTISKTLLRSPRSESHTSRMQATIGDITSPEFLERAGLALCGRPLVLMPDTLKLQDTKNKDKGTPTKEYIGLDVCERLHEDLRSMPGGGLLLHYIKPLLSGKIFYTPDNVITRAIIAQANKTFETVDVQRQYLSRLSGAAKGMTSDPSTRLDLQKLKETLDQPWVRGAMEDLLHSIPTPNDLTSMPSFSSLTDNLKMTYPQLLESSQLVREFSDVLEVGMSLMSCLQLQRFVAVKNESQLLEEANHAVRNKEFLAGVVFQGVGETGSTQSVLPPDLTYTIRVDHSKSPPTFLLGPRFWRPGPYADMAFYMRYQQGFIQLQETLEHSILKLQHQQAKRRGGGAAQQRRRRRSAEVAMPLSDEEEDLLLNLPVHTKQQPYPCYTKDDFLQMVNESPVMSFIFSFLSLVLFSTFLIQQLVQERESRNKQLQEVMGLRLWLDHLVWLLYSLVLLLVIVVLSALLLSLGGLQPRSDFGVLMAFLFCYGLSVVSFCYMVANLIPTTVLAVFIGVMGLLVFNVPFISISVIQTTVPFTAIVLTCLLPSTAFGFGFRIICQYELIEEGANYDNMWSPPTKGSDMTLGLAIIMLLLDTVLFYAITLVYNYFRNDAPQNHFNEGGSEAAPKRASFLQTISGRQTNDFTLNMFPACCSACLTGLPPDSKVASLEEMDSVKKDAVHVVDLDLGLKQSLHKGLSITGLRKIYHNTGGGSRVAVDGVTLDLYEGQVTALLGHNGAGKTTIISMLTHEVEPTAGKITVYGEDVNTSEGWERARQMMGLCPQESVLFPLLTVEETLAYFIALKQRPNDPPPAKVDSVLANMDLLEHRAFLAHQLSEGLRRRLCMALAFVGNSKLVVLDEPTSGIDPLARSAMWEVISNNRAGRTILLTTHHLDEAETLADRVAVLNKGRLMCVGSPLALKSEYGLGYSITLSRAPHPLPTPLAKVKTDSLHAFTEKTALSYSDLPFKVFKSPSHTFSLTKNGGKGGQEKVWEVVTQYVPNARLLENINGEVTYSLPIHDTLGNTNRIPEVFGELENSLDSLGFSSLELRPTSLEDVIITLNTRSAIENVPNTTSLKVELPSDPQKEDLAGRYDFSLEHGECCVWLRRLGALLHKRLLHHGRDWHFYVQMFVLPFLFIFLAMVSSKWRPSFSNATPLTFDPALYPAPAATFLRTLDPILRPLADEVTLLSLGAENRLGNWSSCPEYVADTNPGLEQCSISGSSVYSPCQCVDERCVVETSDQPSLNEWILATRSHHMQNRQAGITLGVRDPREGETGRPGAMVWYDNSAYHALPTYINLLNNARLRRLAGADHSITAINHPIIFTSYGIWSMNIQQYVADLGIGLLVLVAMTVVCSATVGCVVAERVRGERRLLHLAGLSKTTYWISSALWDTGVLVLDVLLIALIFLAFKEQQFIWRENLAAFIVLALLYGLSLFPLFYLSEGLFRTEASAVFSFFCASFGIGLITTLLLVVCQVMSYVKGMQDTAAVIKYLFLVFPPFAFTCSLKDMAAGYARSSIMAHFDMDLYQSPFSWDADLQGGLGVYMVALAAWAAVGWALLILPRPSRAPAPLPLIGEGEEDKDVAAERIKIQCGGTSLYDTVLRLVGLGRDFSSPRVSAVGSLFLALRRGECFSLLGLNGAGKTTTFRCLTGDLRPSRGQILVNGLLLEEALELPRPILSYCPQSHALDPNLTPKEVLTNMARIRGATGPRTAKVVDQAIKQLGLSAEVNTYVRHLSGGNKRKLSVAVSLLGNPLLVLMDEPTTGMDPSSRRLVWQAIQSVPQDGRSVLLTSHSMDEVNQLSHRLAIMVNGHLVCLGSPHYLKYRLGDKYTVRLKTKDIEDMTYVVDYLRSQLKEVLLKEQHHLSLVVEVSRQLPLRLIFDTLNGAKALGVTEYDVSQTTLNEVFRVLTSHQGDGQTPLHPQRATQDQDIHPPLIPHLNRGSGKKPPQNTFQHPSVLAPVECANPKDPYGDFGGMPGKKGRGGSLASDSGSANDSPEEEWTHF